MARRTEIDYGWCAASGSMPKKGRAIENVGDASLAPLQATVFRVAEAARSEREGVAGGDEPRRPRRLAVRGADDGLGAPSEGTAARAAADEAASAAAAGRAGSALERKAALYNRLAASGGGGDDADAEQYSVDFAAKPAWEAARAAAEAGEEAEAERRGALRRATAELAGDTARGRAAAGAAKRAREAEASEGRDALRRKFLAETAARVRAAQQQQKQQRAAAGRSVVADEAT